ncbi:cytochrome p450 -like protein [Brachionus plicatilis]|uniref:Cytochrome p450-like protein n=1 Tax=Brachionus plicatilis TaxID=10195 RepID=A0A3M7PN85_BRAPC|nr:cytochrome p450 -like protein [Brachionus plicatilis]
MRMIMNPTFSSAKLRELGPILVNCADRLIDVLNKEGDAEINVSEYFKRFTMDSIWNCAFGVDINMQYDKENLYLKNCEQFFKVTSNLMLPHYLGLYFHEFKEKIVFFLIIMTLVRSKFVDLDKLSPYFWLKTKIKDLVNKRLFEKESRKRDYIQLLLEACGELNSERFSKNTEFKKSLSAIEVENNLILFMLAGFDTTSTTLGLSCYVLSINSDEQLRLYDEISAVFGTDINSINYDSVQQFKYLDWFIKEVLRHYPVGNSNCIGMKFALIELKIALVKLIMNFEFLPINKEIEFEEGSFRFPKNGVTLLLRKRI